MDERPSVQILLAAYDERYKNLSDLWETLMVIARTTPHQQTASMIRVSANSLENELRNIEKERKKLEKNW